MKKTNQRFAVFEAIYQNHSHPSVDEIVDLVKKTLPMITTESIYRILSDFNKANLISKMPQSALMRYDCNTDNHSHLICPKCNKIVDIYNVEIKLPAELSHCKEMSLTINALCNDCIGA